MGIKENIKYISITGSASIINMLVSIIRVKIVATFLGSQGIGLIGQLNNVINISTFLASFGMESGLVKEVSFSRSRNRNNLADAFRVTFMVASIVFSLITGIAIFFLSEKVSIWLYDSTEFTKYVNIVAAFTLTLGLSIPYSSFLTANKLIKEVFKKSIITSILSTSSTVFLISIWNIDGAVLSLFVNGLINIGVLMFFLKKNAIPLFLSIKGAMGKFKKVLLRRLLEYGSFLMISSIIYQVVSILVKKIIVLNSGIGEMGIYQAMSNITTQYLPVFLTGISTYLLPHLSGQIYISSLNRESNSAVRSILLLSIMPLVLLAAMSKQIIGLLYTSEFVDGSPILLILITFSVFSLTNKILQLSLLARKRLKIILVFDSIVSVCIVSGSYYLYPYFNLMAPAISILFSSVLHLLLILAYLKIEVEFKLELRNVFLIVMLSLGIFILSAVPESSPLMMFIYGILIISVIYIFNLRRSELTSAINYVQNKIDKRNE